PQTQPLASKIEDPGLAALARAPALPCTCAVPNAFSLDNPTPQAVQYHEPGRRLSPRPLPVDRTRSAWKPPEASFMSQTCAHCARINPLDALYCYYDGSALNGAHANGAQAVGAQAFPTPFVFRDGHHCGNFDELALGCQGHWADALDLLKNGTLEQF